MATNGVYYSQYSGFTISTNNTNRVIVSTGGTTIISGDTLDGKVIDVRGVNGPLFSVDDNIVGNILSVVNTSEETILNVNDTSVGIGLNGQPPTNTLHISGPTDPIRVEGFQESSDDTVITIDGSGVLHKLPIASISGITITGTFLPLTGGTVSGDTVFESGLTATTISASNYQNLPTSNLQEVLDNGNTADNQSITISYTGLSGTKQVTLSSKINDLGLYVNNYPSGQDYYQSMFNATYFKIDNLSSSKSITYGLDDVIRNSYVFTYPNNSGYFTLSVNGYTADTTGNVLIPSNYLFLSGGTVTGNTIFQSGLTANTISATTYLNLPIVPGEYLPLSGGSVTGGTIFLSGLTANTISATTYQNLPDNVTGNYLPISGGTVTGGTIFNSGLTASTISATTYQNLPNTIYTGNGTISGNRTVNISGLTLTFSGISTGNGTVRVIGRMSNGASSANATGQFSHAEGTSSAIGQYSHAEGQSTAASSQYSHSEGVNTNASGTWSHAEGSSTISSGSHSHSEGQSTTSSGVGSHAEGLSTTSSGAGSHAEGNSTLSNGLYTHAEGFGTIAIGNYSHSEGNLTVSYGASSHSEGSGTTSYGYFSHSEGFATTSVGTFSHSEGYSGTSIGDYSHVEGSSFYVNNNESINISAVTSIDFVADNGYIFTSNIIATSFGPGSFTVTGNQTGSVFWPSRMNNLVLNGTFKVNGCYYNLGISTAAYSSKDNTTSFLLTPNYPGCPQILYSVSGCGIYSVGQFSHAEGVGTVANGDFSHTEGLGTVADGQGQHVSGRYNTTGNTTSLSIIGNGTEDNRSDLALFNLTGVKFNGYLENGVTVSGTGIYSHAEGTGTISNGNYSHSEGVGFIVSNDNISLTDVWYYQDDFGFYGEEGAAIVSFTQNYFTVEGCISLSTPYTPSFITLTDKFSATTINVNFNYYSPITITSVNCDELLPGEYYTTFNFSSPIESVYYQVSGDSYVRANGLGSHAEGLSTIADGDYQHVSGKHNITGNTTSLFVIGNGTDNNNRSDIVNVNEDGALIYGGLSANTLYVTGLTQTSGITSTGGIIFKQVTINSSYTATTSDYMIDVTGGTFSVTLPSAVGIQGRLLVVKNNGGGAVTVQPILGQTIDDKTFLILGETNTIQLASNGSNWVAISYNISTVNSSTGVFEFSGLSIASTTTFNVAPVKGWVVDDTTNPLSPQLYYVYYSGGTHTATYVNTATETWVYLTSGGTIQQSNITLTEQQRRQNIFLGKLGHANLTNIINAFSQPDFVLSPLSQFRDMFVPINLINGGIYASPNGANLSFNTSANYLYGLGINFANSTLTPNALYVTGTNPCTFQYRTQTGGTSSNTTLIDPTNYDVGGAITPITGTKATNQRIYLVQNGVFRVQYGQQTYNTLAAAIAGLATEQYNTFSNFTNNGILIGILSVLSTATDLSDSSKAQFFFASKFGETVGSAGGVSTTNLQQAYNNSVNPEILTNSTLGALHIKNGDGPDTTATIIEGSNSSGTTTSIIFADGRISGTTLFTNGFTANTNGLTAKTISATTYQNLPTDIRTTGATYSNNTFTFTNNTGGTYSVFFNSVTGLTVTELTVGKNIVVEDGNVTLLQGALVVSGGNTSFINKISATTISATTISATTYQNVSPSVVNPTSTFIPVNSGGTFQNSFLNQSGDILKTTYGGNDKGLNFDFYVDFYSLGGNNASFNVDNSPSGGEVQAIQTLTNYGFRAGTSLAQLGNWQDANKPYIHIDNTKTTVYQPLVANNGLTASTVSATTYQNLPISGLTAGSNISVTNSSGNFTISFTGTTGSNFTGGTVSGATNFTNGLTANTISATTYQNLNAVTGGTYNSTTGIITLSGYGTPGTISLGTDFITAVTESANVISVTKNGGAATTVGTVDAVTGGTYSNGVIILSGTGNVNGNQITGLPTTASTIYTADDTITSNRTVNLSSFTLSFSSSTSANNLMLSGGSVGIGTATPSHKLTVSATIDPVRFINLQPASDSLLLTADGNGVVHTLSTSSIGGLTWNNAVSPLTASTSNGYITTASTTTTITLPTGATFGTVIEIVGNGTGLWVLQQNSGQSIRFGLATTTTSTGVLSATSRGDCVRLVCTTTNTGFQVLSAIGNIFYN